MKKKKSSGGGGRQTQRTRRRRRRTAMLHDTREKNNNRRRRRRVLAPTCARLRNLSCCCSSSGRRRRRRRWDGNGVLGVQKLLDRLDVLFGDSDDAFGFVQVNERKRRLKTRKCFERTLKTRDGQRDGNGPTETERV